jgi:hypothetical protein
LEVISVISSHFLESHKTERLAGCTLQRVALRGRVKTDHQKCRGILVSKGKGNITFLGELEQETGYLVLAQYIHTY